MFFDPPSNKIYTWKNDLWPILPTYKKYGNDHTVFFLLWFLNQSEKYIVWFIIIQSKTDCLSLKATNHRDYATLMALSASKQGQGAEAAQQKLKQELNGRSWSEYCAAINRKIWTQGSQMWYEL